MEDIPQDTSQYGDQAECAVCKKELDRPPKPPQVEGLDLCRDHTEEDYQEFKEAMREQMTRRQKRMEERYAEQQDFYNER